MIDPVYEDSALYDAMVADIVADVSLFVAMARAAAGPVLEVCCGTGRVLVPTAEAGVDVDGLDLSPAMLAGLSARLGERNLRAGVHQGDMRDFALPRRYALVLVPFNSFLHNLTQADQVATLRRCRAHLAPGGRLVLAVFHPDARKLVQQVAGEEPPKEFPGEGGRARVRLVDQTEDERVEQVRRVRRRVEFLDLSGRVARAASTSFTLRYVFKPEMELLLAAAGFPRVTVQPVDTDPVTGGWFPADRPAREGDVLLWTAWPE